MLGKLDAEVVQPLRVSRDLQRDLLILQQGDGDAAQWFQRKQCL